MTVIRVEMRCPNGPKRLLAAMRKNGEYVKVNTYNLMELSCRDCKNSILDIYGNKPYRVLHLYNVVGQYVEDDIQWEAPQATLPGFEEIQSARADT